MIVRAWRCYTTFLLKTARRQLTALYANMPYVLQAPAGKPNGAFFQPGTKEHKAGDSNRMLCAGILG